MQRLIDANAFLERVLPECKYPELLKKAVDEQPTIEAAPVRHGWWNEKGHCECCGYDMGSRVDKWTNVFDFQFCPNCGAYMREEGAMNGADA